MKRRSPLDSASAGSTHRSLVRGLSLLEAVALSGGTSLGDAARRTGLHRSTAHHLLQTLVALDYLRQDPESRGYGLGPRPFHLAIGTWSAAALGELAQPFLAELTRRSGEGSSLAVCRDGAVTVVAKREPDGPVRVGRSMAAQRPVHATAVGKAIAAWLPPAEVAGLLRQSPLARHTRNTIVSHRRLEAELRRVRRLGYAIDDEEHIQGIRCIAMPVLGYAGQVIASMCALGPKSRVTHQRLRELRRPLAELTHEFSLQLCRADRNGATTNRTT
jgi:DNA-binding IclR family transcriptional regulator